LGRVYRIESHPTRTCFEQFYHYDEYDRRNQKGSFPLPVVGRLKVLSARFKLPLHKIEKMDMANANLCSKVVFPFSLKGADKNNQEKCKQDFLCMKNTLYKEYTEIYTDGSKINDRTGCAFVVNDTTYKVRLTRHSSVFSAELFAILKSLRYVKNSADSKFVIFSDSLSAIESIKNNKNKNALNIKINQILGSIHDKSIVFEWVPSHCKIPGNELADKAAKDATEERYIHRLPLNVAEFNSIVKREVFASWQDKWDKDCKKRPKPSHLYRIKPKLGDWKSSYRDNRREEVVLSRMRTGTCRYQSQHYYKIGNTNPMNKCNLCGVANNIEHVILSCPKWGAFRIMIYEQNKKQKLPNSISSVLGDKFNHGILFTYLKSIKYFDLI